MFKTSKLILVLISFIGVGSMAQTGPERRTYILSGVSCTVDLYDNHNKSDLVFPSSYSMYAAQPVYLGPLLHFNRCFYKGQNFMFQTGIEYALNSFYIVQIYPILKRGPYYANVKMLVNSFSIPAYFNLNTVDRNFFCGLGPVLTVVPFSWTSGYLGASGNKVKGSYGPRLDAALALKVGKFFKINNSTFVLEAKAAHGLSNLLQGYGVELHNDYFSLGIGYMFNKKLKE